MQNRSRLAVEQLENRLVPSSSPAAIGVQTQTIADPANAGSGLQYQRIAAGVYQTVVSQAVTVGANQTGLFNLTFQAQAFDSIANRAGIRYLIDGQPDPNDAVFIKAGTAADAIEDIAAGAYQTLFLSRLITLSAGTHIVSVQVTCNTLAFSPDQQLVVFTPNLSIVGYSTIDGHSAADGVQAHLLTNPISAAVREQNIVAGSYQTVVSQTVTVGGSKTGLYDLAFQAQAFSSSSNLVFVRYLIDGRTDAKDLAINATGADVTESFSNGLGLGSWHTLYLTHQLALTPGKHTISVQVRCTTPGILGPDLIVYTPSLSLVGYNTIAGQRAADGLQIQTSTSGAAGRQNIVAGSFQTVASASITVGASKTGLFQLAFQTQAFANTPNRAYVRYLIDGKLDPNDQAVIDSATEADTTVDFLNGLGADTWHTLALTRLLALTPGRHTISVQVACSNQGATPGRDLVVVAPNFSLTGYNNIVTLADSPFFTYSASARTLTVNGTAGDDYFLVTQSTSSTGSGVLSTTYVFSINGVSESFTADQLTRVNVNGKGGNDVGNVIANDTYVGADGKTRETREQVVLNAGGGILQTYHAGNDASTFLQLRNFATIYAYMGRADTAQMHDSAGDDAFVTAGSYSYTSGPGYFNLVSGAVAVHGYTTNGGNDQAYHYDGTGPSTFTAAGAAYSSMQGTDNGVSFFNKAVGFRFNYGIATRSTQAVAYINATAARQVFVGNTAMSYLYAVGANGMFAMYDAAFGFAKVYATASAAGGDFAYNYDTTVNVVTGFQRLA